MRLDAMTVGMLREAMSIYRERAYEDPPADPVVPAGDDGDPISDCLSMFVDESLREAGQATQRYTLKMGNARYPFMKLVLQEHLVEGEFFFEVDSHDQMFVLDGDEGQRFDRLRRFNHEVKASVEEAWDRKDLPTAAHIKGLVATWPRKRIEPNGLRLLLVDNDDDIAQTLALLLQAQGFEVDILHDGRDAVEQADAARHDLILMDNEMKHLNGFEACRVLKSRPETKGIPVLIATAGSLTLSQLDAADGFMVKPFRVELLLSILKQMLGRT